MDVLFGTVAFLLVISGAVLIGFAERHRTPASLAREDVARRHISWYFTRRFYTLDEFDSQGRRAFRLGRILLLSSALVTYVGFILRPH